MQEEFRDEPWKLLVACICLNQCSAKVARPVWENIFKAYPTMDHLLLDVEMAEQDLGWRLRPLGFQNVRAKRIVRMTRDLADELARVSRHVRHVRVEQLYGCGKYASDSYEIFVKGNTPLSVDEVDDKELKNYVRWALENAT